MNKKGFTLVELLAVLVILSIIFFHLMVNIGMTIGLMPVIGIPLPFLSYGGSSLLMFSTMFFVFLKQDANRMNIL